MVGAAVFGRPFAAVSQALLPAVTGAGPGVEVVQADNVSPVSPVPGAASHPPISRPGSGRASSRIRPRPELLSDADRRVGGRRPSCRRYRSDRRGEGNPGRILAAFFM